MALTALLPDDAALMEYSYTTGIGTYTLAGAYSGRLPFSAEYATGAHITYRVTDGSAGNAANVEIGMGVYDAAAKTLTRATILASSNGGAAVNWSGRTRLIVHALNAGLPLCATPPMAGQVLVWDAVAHDYCPQTIGTSSAPIAGLPLCPTAPTVGQVLVWDAVHNWYCPADFCALVAACMS